MSDEMCRYERQPFTYHACSEESTWLSCVRRRIGKKARSDSREKRETTADDSLGSTPSVWGWLVEANGRWTTGGRQEGAVRLGVVGGIPHSTGSWFFNPRASSNT
eukprot:scaffold5185_cov198-Alexandrium_tamarense.AAC.22